MRMFFVLKEKLAPFQSEHQARVIADLQAQFSRNEKRASANSNK
jgi:hypothetical protein